MKNTTSLGDRSELEIATALMRIGKSILRPLSAGLRYDLAVDNGDGTIMRLQCKTGILKSGAIYFRACNADGRRPNGVPYRGQIEAFAVFCPQTGGTYLVPIAALASISTARLRIDPARNGQFKGVLFARDFQISGSLGPEPVTKSRRPVEKDRIRQRACCRGRDRNLTGERRRIAIEDPESGPPITEPSAP